MRYPILGVFCLLTGFGAEAGILFGDKNSSIIVEEGSTFVIASDLTVTGTIVNEGTLTVDSGASFDYSCGTFIDHGGHIRTFNHNTTIYKDINLSPVSLMTIAALGDGGGTITLTGSGQKITFSDGGGVQLVIGDNTAVVLSNLELAGFQPGAISLGDGASLTISSGVLSLNQDVWSFSYPITFVGSLENPSYVRGNSKLIDFYDEGAFVIANESVLQIEDITFWRINGEPVQMDDDGAVCFNNCLFKLDGDMTISQGHLLIGDTATFTGVGSLIYSSPSSIRLSANSSMVFNQVAFIYGSGDDDANELIGDGIGEASQIILDDAQFYVQVPSLSLIGVTLISKGSSKLYGTGSGASEINFGDGYTYGRNSKLLIEDGILEMYDIVCNVQDASGV
ncbi:MAG: hypothetical protein QG604_325 [Candidatus Dependentiae bacterium]|nr:hypothetical protein [Candidatus Dependentiae bacterium]